MLEKLSDELAKAGVALHLANAHAAAREVGHIDRTLSLADVVEHWQRENPMPSRA